MGILIYLQYPVRGGKAEKQVVSSKKNFRLYESSKNEQNIAFDVIISLIDTWTKETSSKDTESYQNGKSYDLHVTFSWTLPKQSTRMTLAFD